MTLPTTTKLDLVLEDGWLTVWLNTPENRNALSDALAGELRDTFEAVRDDRTVRGVTIRGRGGIFCAGGDLKAFMAALSGGLSRDEAAAMNRTGGDLFRRVNDAPQVVIALIEGAAIAGGLGLACCADIVVAHKDAKFSLTETQIGVVPAQIAPHVVRRIGETAARRLMLTGARFTGDEAAALGVADYVVDAVDALDTEERRLREAVKRCAPGANAATKALIADLNEMDAAQSIERAADAFADRLTSDEGAEGIRAFFEKRKPKWAE